jgi:thioredoxin reductase (NADPH)
LDQPLTVPTPQPAFSTDVAVIGAGPVGLFTVFQFGMLGMKCHIIDSLEAIGGQCTALYPEKPIYDIPGYPEISGGRLISALERQAEPFAPHFHLNQQVIGLEGNAGAFHITTSQNTMIAAKVVIIAAGVGAFGPKRPPLPNIETFEAAGPGLGVNYMVRRTKDFAGKRVVIAGGGDSAVDWAVILAGVAAKVIVVHRRATFRAMPESVRQLESLVEDGSVELMTPFQLAGVSGTDGTLQTVTIADLDGNARAIDADVLLPFYGLSQDLGPIRDWGLGDSRRGVAINPVTAETGRAGIFAVGDVAEYPGKLKLILTGFSEAAFAAHRAHDIVFPEEALHFEYSTTKGIPRPGDMS